NGSVAAQAGVSYVVVQGHVEGGIEFGVHVGLTDAADSDGDAKIRVFTGEIASAFVLDAVASAFIDIDIKVGVDVAGNFIGAEYKLPLAKATIFDEHLTNINPFNPPDVHLAHVL